MTIPSAGKNDVQVKFPYTVSRHDSDTDTMENSLSVSDHIKQQSYSWVFTQVK